MVHSDEARTDNWRPLVARGVVTFAALGAALGGAAGTLSWPVVGTFFVAVPSATAGAGSGLVTAVLLGLLTRRTRSKWAARVTSGVAAAAATTGACALAHASVTLAVVLAASAVVLGGVVGPIISFGADFAGRPPRSGDVPAATFRRFLVIGSGCGAGVGAVTGLVIGVVAYLPTAPVAAVEGGVLGAVTGAVLACLAAGVRVLPRLRARS